MSVTTGSRPHLDKVTVEQLDALRRDGITAQKGAFTRERHPKAAARYLRRRWRGE